MIAVRLLPSRLLELKEQSHKKITRLTIVTIITLLVFSTIFSVFVFAQTSLRLDEAQSLFQVSRDMQGVLYLVGQDVHVPLYHILLHFWVLMFGNDIFIARLMSLLFLLLTIVAVFFFGRYAFSTKIGLFAAFLVTISPFMQWYGSEARMYTLLALITILHQFVFLKIYRENKTIHWIFFVVTAILGMYTHYFFAFVLLTEVIFYFLYRKSFARGSLKKFAISSVVVVLSLLPWLLYVRSLGTASNTQPYLETPSSGDLFNTYAQFIFGFQVDNLNTIIISLWPIVVLLAFFALRKGRTIPRSAIFLVCAAILPVVIAFLASILFKPFYQSRYLIVALPPLLILLSWVLASYPKRISWGLRVILIVAIGGLFVVQAVSPNTPVKEDYRAASDYLEQHATSKDVIILAAPFTIYPVEYYYTGDSKVTTQPIWDRFREGSVPSFNESVVDAQTRTNVASYQTAWLLLSYDQGYNNKLKSYYDTHYERLGVVKFSPGLQLYQYKLRYDLGLSIK